MTTALRLQTFGGLALLPAAGPVLPTQRRRLAVLALLAAAGERGIPRDRVLLYLWPESNSDDARHSLEQLLYGLRRDLGSELFLSSGPLVLNTAILGADVSEFDAAIARGDWALAVRLYTGPFLDGFALPDLAEFEEWTTTQRRTRSDKCCVALEALATKAQQDGDGAYAVDLWRRHVEIDPLAARGALGLMRALAEAGDRAAALQHARDYEQTLLHTLQIPLDDEVAAYVAELRRRPEAGHAGRAHASVTGRLDVRDPPGRPIPAAAAPGPFTRSRWHSAALVIPVLLLLAPAGWWSWQRFTPENAAGPLDRNAIVVIPFRFTGADSTHAYLAEGMVDLLGARLIGSGGPAAVDARRAVSAWRQHTRGDARSAPPVRRIGRVVGAAEALTGEVTATGDAQLALSARIVDVASERTIAQASVTGASDSLLALTDQLAARLLAFRAGSPAHSMASLTTASLPALRAFLEGRAAFRRAEYARALQHLTTAIEWDSTFGLAGLTMAAAANLAFKLRPGDQATADVGWLAEADSAWRRGVELAWQQRARLSTSDRIFLQALRGSRYPLATSVREQIGNWEQAVQAVPDRADAWYHFGLILLYQGQSIDMADAHERAIIALERAVALDSSFPGPLAALLEVAANAGDRARVRRLSELYLARDAGDLEEYVRWRSATALGDSAQLRELRSRMGSWSTASLARLQWTSQVAGISLGDADRAAAELLRRAITPTDRARALGQARMLAMNRGRPREARRLEQSVRDLEGLEYWNPAFRMLYALFWDGEQQVGEETAGQFARDAVPAYATYPRVPAGRSNGFVLALWRLNLGDTSGAAGTLQRLRDAERRDAESAAPARAATFHRAAVLEAWLASANRRADAAARLERLDSLTLVGCCQTPHYTPLIVARLREHGGDLAGALRAIRRGRWFFPPEYLSTYLREEARLSARTGDSAAAVRALRHYLALRADPEPALRADAERMRALLRQLEREE